MSTQAPLHTVNQPVPAEVPDERTYEEEEDAQLDKSLVDSIEAAEAAQNHYLKRILALELASHYYETRR